MSNPQDDLRSTEDSIRRDAERLKQLEDQKASLDPTDPLVERLSVQIERLANGLQVVRSTNYESLFGMLQLKRADYFPRAVTEPWDELQAPGRDGLVVEPRLLLRYTTDNYFFTGRHNPRLADRIERGLRLAIADGSFEHLFRNHPANARALARANLAERRIIELKNPLLSPETPVHDPSLWFHLS